MEWESGHWISPVCFPGLSASHGDCSSQTPWKHPCQKLWVPNAAGALPWTGVRHSQQGQNPGNLPPTVHRGCLRYPRCTWGSWACAIRAVHMGSLVLLSGCQPEAPLRTARLGGLQHLGFRPGRIQKQRHVGENAWSFSFCQTALSCAGRRLVLAGCRNNSLGPSRQGCHLGQALTPHFSSPSFMAQATSEHPLRPYNHPRGRCLQPSW